MRQIRHFMMASDLLGLTVWDLCRKNGRAVFSHADRLWKFSGI